MTYERATYGQDTESPDERAPPMPIFYKDSEHGLARSTVHRWITTLGSLQKTLQAAMSLLLEKGAGIHRQIVHVAARKYRSTERKNLLQDALRLIHAEAAYRATFRCSIFPHLATACAWL